MTLAADYPFLDIFWTMLVFFLWVLRFLSLMLVRAGVVSPQDAGRGHGLAT